jgi:nitroreductase
VTTTRENLVVVFAGRSIGTPRQGRDGEDRSGERVATHRGFSKEDDEMTNATEPTSEEVSRPMPSAACDAAGALTDIYRRRAVRSYAKEPVTREDIQLLIDAAIHAPSAVNVQPWAFAIVQDAGTLARYAAEGKAILTDEPPSVEVVESGLPELDRLRQMAAREDFALFHDAPLMIVIYATSLDGVPDCVLAAQNLMLAASSIGLGTCPIGLARPLFNQAGLKDELGASRDWTCALPIVIGRTFGDTPATSRRPAQIVFWK